MVISSVEEKSTRQVNDSENVGVGVPGNVESTAAEAVHAGSSP